MANSLMSAASSVTGPSIRQGIPFKKEACSNNGVSQRGEVAYLDHDAVAVLRRFPGDIGAQPGFSNWRERFERDKSDLTCCKKTGSLTGRDCVLEERIFHRILG